MKKFIYKTLAILSSFFCICFNSCFRDAIEKDKYPELKLLEDSSNNDFEVIKTSYYDYGEANTFNFVTDDDKNLILLNKGFSEIKQINITKETSRFAIFNNDAIFVIHGDPYKGPFSANLHLPFSENIEEITYDPTPISFFDEIMDSFTQEEKQAYRSWKKPATDLMDSLFNEKMKAHFNKTPKVAYEIKFVLDGKYCVLDYGDHKVFYRDKRRNYAKSCWEDIKQYDQLDFIKNTTIKPFDKAFTRRVKNEAIGGTLQNGYQYFSLKTKSKELKFKKFLGSYFDPAGQYFEVYVNEDRSKILLQDCLPTQTNLYWVIEK